MDLGSPLSEFLGTAVFAIILFYGGKSVLLDESMDGALLITYLVMFSQMLIPAKSFTAAYYSVQKGLAHPEVGPCHKHREVASSRCSVQ